MPLYHPVIKDDDNKIHNAINAIHKETGIDKSRILSILIKSALPSAKAIFANIPR